MRRHERGYSLAEMMIGVLAFSMILGSIVFMITRWQQTTSITRTQRSLAVEARDAMRMIMKDVREASYIYHWTDLNLSIRSPAIPGAQPHHVKTGYGDGRLIPAVAPAAFAAGAAAAVGDPSGAFGLGEENLAARLSGTATASSHVLALASLAEGGLTRPTYIVYFTAPEPGSDDYVHHVYRFQFRPDADAPADTWHPMNETFTEQAPSTRSLTITANAGGNGVLKEVTGDENDVPGKWQLRRLFSTLDLDPNWRYKRGLFFIRQLHPWADETPISPMLVEVTVVPAKRYGSRIVSFPLFGRGYARNVAMPSAK